MGLAFALEMGAFWAHGMKKFQKLERLDERGEDSLKKKNDSVKNYKENFLLLDFLIPN